MIIKNEKLAFYVAPLLAPVVFTAIIAFEVISTDIGGFFESILVVGIFAIPIAYIVATIFGLPIYYLFKKYKLINFWSLSIGGSVVAIIPVLILQMFGAYSANEFDKLFTLIGVIGVTGYCVGIAYWAIVQIKPHNKSLKHDAQKARAS